VHEKCADRSATATPADVHNVAAIAIGDTHAKILRTVVAPSDSDACGAPQPNRDLRNARLGKHRGNVTLQPSRVVVGRRIVHNEPAAHTAGESIQRR
jgi:hypothetical protein